MREPGKIEVSFTPRVFPTAARESTAHEEEQVNKSLTHHKNLGAFETYLFWPVMQPISRTVQSSARQTSVWTKEVGATIHCKFVWFWPTRSPNVSLTGEQTWKHGHRIPKNDVYCCCNVTLRHNVSNDPCIVVAQWLKKQAEAKRIIEVENEDLTEEEKNPVWLKDKAKYVYNSLEERIVCVVWGWYSSRNTTDRYGRNRQAVSQKKTKDRTTSL